ncbi:MAG: hypothetical protein J6W70_07765 [Lentisphaeria bacterium]|nr:hypothetical protein [Lentisphaeria bacterium]
MNIARIQLVIPYKPGNLLEKTAFFHALRLDFWKEHDKLLIDFDTQNKLIEEITRSKSNGGSCATAVQLNHFETLIKILNKSQKHGGRWFRPVTCLLRNLRSDELEYDTRARIAGDAASLRQRGTCARLGRAPAMSPLESCHVRPQISFFHTGLLKLKTPFVRNASVGMWTVPVSQARTAPRNGLVPFPGGCCPISI